MRRLAFLLGLPALGWALASPASAYMLGITTDNLVGLGCNNCHSGGNDPLVQVDGPQFVRPLSTHTYTASISTTATQLFGGFNASATDGTLSLGGKYAAQTQILANGMSVDEITHVGAKAAKGGFTRFSFQWTAPAAFTSESLNVWGNAVNNDGANGGDKGTFQPLTVTNGEFEICPASPGGACVLPTKSSIAITDSTIDDAKDSLTFTWNKGLAEVLGADVGNPTTNTDYAVCVYVDGSLVAELDVPAATTCGKKDCWSLKGDPMSPTGIKYKDKIGAPSGVKSMKVTPGVVGKAKLAVKAKGVDLPDPGILPLGASTLTVQVHNNQTAACFGDSFSGLEVKKDDGAKYKAKAVNP